MHIILLNLEITELGNVRVVGRCKCHGYIKNCECLCLRKEEVEYKEVLTVRDFLYQNWGIFVFIGVMMLMHLRGAGGCCGGGMQYSPKETKNSGSGSTIQEKEVK